MRNPIGALVTLVLVFAGAPALAGCGGHIILGFPDSGEPASTTTCTSDDECVGGQPGSCQRGQCTTSLDDGGSGSGRGGQGTGGPFPVCPGLKPASGSPCPIQNQGCAYVDLKAGTCESWTCSASNEWVSSTPAGC